MMIKNRIALKLTTYFATSLLVFSLVIGGIFILLFQNYNMDFHRKELQERAETIATTMATFMDDTATREPQNGYGAYLRFIDEIMLTDVWIIDENRNLFTKQSEKQPEMQSEKQSEKQKGKHGNMEKEDEIITYQSLPDNADAVINSVFQGQTPVSESFSDVLQAPTLTVGAPIKNASGEIIGAVLLHSPIDDINAAIQQGITILAISIFAALVISIALSILFSITFTKPLNIIKQTSLRLAKKDYTAHTNIKQNDEIGEVAATIDQLAEKLKLADQQNEQLEQLRQDFIANISHELRTPVTVIRGSLEAIIDKVVTKPKQVTEYHSQMLKETIFLQRLLTDLLEVSKLQNKDFPLEFVPILFNDVLQDALRSATHLADTKNIVIELEATAKQLKIMGDYARIRQMILILLDNAIKFSNDSATIHVTFTDTMLKITDTGVGISKEDLPHLFKKFYQSRSEENKEGSGLGLSIAESIATRHNIAISLESEEGKGTTVTLSLESIPLLK